MKKDKTSLIILTWNEIDAIKKIWSQIPLKKVDEVIFIDPGSNDGTIEFIKSKGQHVIIQKKPGRGNAFLECLKRAKYKNLIFFSGDGNEDPKEIPKIIKYLNEGYDLVIAGRHLLPGAKSDDSDDPLLLRKLVTIILGKIIDIFWQSKVKDPINGLRGMKKHSMIKMNLDAQKHEIEFQSTIRAAKLGLRIKEFPTKELPRVGGERKPTAGSLALGLLHCYYLLKEIFIGQKFRR